MSRTLPSAVSSAIASTITSPGRLIEIAFASPGAPFRVSSRGTCKVGGNVFIPYGFAVSGLGADAGQSSTSGSATFADLQNILTTLVLGQGVADVPVSVWTFYGDPSGPDYTLSAGDLFLEFVGVGNECSIDPSTGRVTISFVQTGGPQTYGPRTYCTSEQGFSRLPVPGTVIPWGGENFVLEDGGANG